MESFEPHPTTQSPSGPRAVKRASVSQTTASPPWNDETRSLLVSAAERALGRDLSGHDPAFLDATLARRVGQSGLDVLAYATALGDDPAEAGRLWQLLNNSYSVFFRNPLTFALLEQFALPALAQARERDGQEMRIWSAGCAAGQEAYSLAMLLEDLAATRVHGPRFRIFATDHCTANLAQARRGVYDQAAMQNVRLRHLHAFFTRLGDHYEVIPTVRARVDFSAHNLLDPHAPRPQASIFGEFDFIICGNVLLYYRPRVRSLILARLHAALAPHGFLVIDEAERDLATPSDGFRPVTPPSALFQKIP